MDVAAEDDNNSSDGNNCLKRRNFSKTWNRLFDGGQPLKLETLKKYWLFAVPHVYKLPMNSNCLNWSPNEEEIQRTLIEPLERVMSGQQSPTQFFDDVKKSCSPSSICGSVFKMSEPTYNCRECSTDPTCVLCVDCFMNSEHRYHKYKMSTSSGGGCCDCGDIEAWQNFPHCNVHVVGVGDKAEETAREFSSETYDRCLSLFRCVLNYCFELLAVEHVPDLPKDLRLYTDVDMTTVADTYCTVLYNDESHTFEHVISTLHKVMKIDNKEAVEIVTNIDRVGRSIVKSAGFRACEELKDDIERVTSRNSANPLKVTVVHTDVISHQMLAVRLLSWLRDILTRSRYFRTIFAEAVTTTTTTPTTNTNVDTASKANSDANGGNSRCLAERVLLRDAALWKMARVQWHRLFITGLMMEYESKKRFACLFTKNYGNIMRDFVRDDHEHTVSIASMGVQLYTVPSIAHFLIAKLNALFVVLNSLLVECNPYVKTGVNRLEFQRNVPATSFKRAQYTLYDIHYLLTTVPNEWTSDLRTNFLQGFLMFLRLLTYMQCMDSAIRQVGQHMEYEPEWETAFNLHMRLTSVITSTLKWCGSDRAVFIKAFKATRKTLSDYYAQNLIRECDVKQLVGHQASCIRYDVGLKPVSIHLPLNRLLSGLYLYLERYGLTYDCDEFAYQEHKLEPEQLIEPVLRTQVMIAQVHAGLWRRNGYSILHQIYFYHNVRCRSEMFDQDIVMLQIGASLIDGDQFMLHLLHKYRLLQWADREFERQIFKKIEDDTVRHTVTLLEEFLLLLIFVVGERYKVGVGRVTADDCLKNEVIQQLCIKPMSHSELNRELPDESGHHDTGVDRVINQVADFKKPTNGSGKGMYELKEEYYDRYNVFYYHYNKEELSKSEEVQRKRRRRRGLLECCPPPVLPELTDTFKTIPTLLQCDVTLHVMQTVLERALDPNAQSFSEAQLHRVLHLIGIGLMEEESRHYDYLSFTDRLNRWGLLQSLDNLLKNNRYNSRVETHKDYIKWTLKKYAQVHRATHPGKHHQEETLNKRRQNDDLEDDDEFTATSNSSISSGSSRKVPTAKMFKDDLEAMNVDGEDDRQVVAANKGEQEEEKQRKIKEAAKERRAKVMAQMAAMQRRFMTVNQQLFEESDVKENGNSGANKVADGDKSLSDHRDDASQRINDRQSLAETDDQLLFPVAIGLGQTKRDTVDESFICILCQESEEIALDSAPAMVYLAFVQRSSVLSRHHHRDNEDKSKKEAMDVLYTPVTFSQCPFISTCGHVMHSACWRKHFSNVLEKEVRRPYRSRQGSSYDVEKKEFLCPLCESLCNTVLPILPALDQIGDKSSSSARLLYDHWMKSHFLINSSDRNRLLSSSPDDGNAVNMTASRLADEQRANNNSSSTSSSSSSSSNSSSSGNAGGQTSVDVREQQEIGSQRGRLRDDDEQPMEQDDENQTMSMPGTVDNDDMAMQQDESPSPDVVEPDDEDDDDPLSMILPATQLNITLENFMIINDDGSPVQIVVYDAMKNADETNRQTFGSTIDDDDKTTMIRMSTDVVEMMDTLSKAVYVKSIGDDHFNKSNGALLVWKCCAYTVHVIERQLRTDASKSLLGGLSNGQRVCLQALIRVCALNVKYKSCGDLIRLSNTLTNMAFGKSCRPNFSVLESDPFSMLVSLTMSSPAAYNDNPRTLPSGGEIDSHIFKFMFTVSLIQIVCNSKLAPETFVDVNTDDDNDNDDDNDDNGGDGRDAGERNTIVLSKWVVHRVWKMFHDEQTTPVNRTRLWREVTTRVRPFLRCCAIFYHFLTRVSPPRCLLQPDGDTFENLCRYLGVTDCDDFVLSTAATSCVRWKADVNFRAKVNARSDEEYLPVRRLIWLPEDYSDLINSVSHFSCPNSGHEDSRNPTLCLICGTILCSQSYCCQTLINDVHYGACAGHAYRCGNGAGIFLRIRECEILLLSFPSRGCFLAAPYVDEYGETDQGLRRGNPLKLCPVRFAKYNQMWLGHAIHAEVTRALESSPTVPLTQWQHF